MSETQLISKIISLILLSNMRLKNRGKCTPTNRLKNYLGEHQIPEGRDGPVRT